MFCSNCGKNIPAGSNVCPYCGKPVAGMRGGTYQGQPARIDNIFTALVNERTAGAIWEFSLWCAVCLSVIFSLAALISVDWWGEVSALCRMVWLFVMLFEAGTGVLMAFRLKPIMLYASSLAIQLLMTIFLYALFAYIYVEIRDEVAVGMLFTFILLLLVALGLAVCSSIHFFTRTELGKISAILDVVVAGLMLIFAIVVGVSTSSLRWAIIGNTGFGLGITSLVIVNAVIAVFYMLFFFGCIDSSKRKIINYGGSSGGTQRAKAPFSPGVQCIRGQYQGQVMYLQGQELTFGSQAASAAIVIPSPHVSHRHCAIRYNPGMGMYEVVDFSANGVYVTAQSGGTQRIPAGSYVPCARGSVISLGSMEQQFRLL
ncbi:MAG: FHA domain-containing protein [Roseburia sp.]|nr:FHA domain-containing protein [Roseburia sp.]